MPRRMECALRLIAPTHARLPPSDLAHTIHASSHAWCRGAIRPHLDGTSKVSCWSMMREQSCTSRTCLGLAAPCRTAGRAMQPSRPCSRRRTRRSVSAAAARGAYCRVGLVGVLRLHERAAVALSTPPVEPPRRKRGAHHLPHRRCRGAWGVGVWRARTDARTPAALTARAHDLCTHACDAVRGRSTRAVEKPLAEACEHSRTSCMADRVNVHRLRHGRCRGEQSAAAPPSRGYHRVCDRPCVPSPSQRVLM